MKQMNVPNDVNTKLVGALEDELKAAEERAAEERFLQMMKNIKAKQTDFHCSRCHQKFWFAEGTALCRCRDKSFWSLRTETCVICGSIVEHVVRDTNTGYDYHPLPSQHFRVQPFSTIKGDNDTVSLCSKCEGQRNRNIAKVTAMLEEEREGLKYDKAQCKQAREEFDEKKRELRIGEEKVRKLERRLKALTKPTTTTHTNIKE